MNKQPLKKPFGLFYNRVMKRFILVLLFILSLSGHTAAPFPSHWWKHYPHDPGKPWEILPQEAHYEEEVILSKRNELGVFSNFAHTPFVLDGVRYESVEGFWQSLKYPEGPRDERLKNPNLVWPYSRGHVGTLVGREAKRAGDVANENMDRLGINWVTYRKRRMVLYTPTKGDHYRLIKRAIRAKLEQNPALIELLLSTRYLKLLPDHKVNWYLPPAWKYFNILMDLRTEYWYQRYPRR